jgi:hypothetical protein
MQRIAKVPLAQQVPWSLLHILTTSRLSPLTLALLDIAGKGFRVR